jgi:uncharacterized membrane protein
MDAMLILQSIFRWFHILAGIVWIGHLYFFNFVNAPLQAVLDGGVKKQVNPSCCRGLFWFRWGAAWTWITGVLLLLLVFYHGGSCSTPRAGPRALSSWSPSCSSPLHLTRCSASRR